MKKKLGYRITKNSIISPDFIYMNKKDMEEAYSILKIITIFSIIDREFRIVEVISLDDVYNYLEGKCKN